MGASRLEARAVQVVRRRRERQPGIGEPDRSTEGRGRTALVTGASSGIGRAMAELLAAKGYDVVVVARREHRLAELKAELEARWDVAVTPLPCDLSRAEASAAIVAALDRQSLPIDFLVNNAGYDMIGKYLEPTWAEHEQVLNVMARGVAELTHHLLPHMVEQRWGRIINVASVGAMFPGSPSMAMYTATKSFVLKLSEAIAAEYADHNVHCTVSAPGATATEIFDGPGITEYWDNNLLPQLAMMRSETVVRQAYDGSMAGRKVVIHGFQNKVWAFTLQHSPPAVRYRLVDFLSNMNPHPS